MLKYGKKDKGQTQATFRYLLVAGIYLTLGSRIEKYVCLELCG